jgi:peptidoglycan/LPS O-acetylase OafA/YrhL
LRFIAIFSVVLFHLGGELSHRSGRVIPIEPRYLPLFGLVANGDRGVRLFFVISGMILAMPFARHSLAAAKTVSLRKYYLRRVTRLEPPYILSMLLFILMVAIYTHGQLGPGFAYHALASTFYLHGLLYADMSPVNPITWSLEVEIQFYLLAPLFMQLFRIKSLATRRLVMIVCILSLGLVQAPLRANPRFILSILFYVQYFIAGLLLADIFVLDLPRMRSTWLWDLAGLTCFGLMYGIGHDVYAAHVFLRFALGTLCLAAMRSVALRKFVANPWIAVVGGMCYSIYLLHFALIAALFKLTRRVIVPQFDYLGNFAIQLCVTGIPVVLLSALFYVLVERPCMDPNWPSKLRQWAAGTAEKAELL